MLTVMGVPIKDACPASAVATGRNATEEQLLGGHVHVLADLEGVGVVDEQEDEKEGNRVQQEFHKEVSALCHFQGLLSRQPWRAARKRGTTLRTFRRPRPTAAGIPQGSIGAMPLPGAPQPHATAAALACAGNRSVTLLVINTSNPTVMPTVISRLDAHPSAETCLAVSSL